MPDHESHPLLTAVPTPPSSDPVPPSTDEQLTSEHVPIADALVELGITRPTLLRQLRLSQLDDLRYVPAEGGWFVPRQAVRDIAARLEARG